MTTKRYLPSWLTSTQHEANSPLITERRTADRRAPRMPFGASVKLETRPGRARGSARRGVCVRDEEQLRVDGAELASELSVPLAGSETLRGER